MAKVKLYSTEEVAELTDRTERTIQKLVERYPDLGVRVGNSHVFFQEDIDFIRKINRKGGRPPMNPADLKKPRRAAVKA